MVYYARKRNINISILLVIVFIIIIGYSQRGRNNMEYDNFKITIENMKLVLTDMEGQHNALCGQLGVGIPAHIQPSICTDAGNGHCLVWKDIAKLTVTSLGERCYKIRWESLTRDYNPTDCYELGDHRWFGGPELYEQRWPVHKQQIPMQQFRSNDFLMDKSCHTLIGPIADAYWFNSRGAAIYVDSDIPLHVGFNEDNNGRLYLRADFEGYETPRSYKDKLVLSYIICLAADAKAIHSHMASTFIEKPERLPDKRVFRSPIWSSWARYKTGVSQKNIMDYANEIEQHGFSHSQIEIDDMYTTAYGEFDFDIKKFPNPTKMVNDLHARGFRVTSWIIPFANLNSKAFQEGMEKGYWIQDVKGRVPSLVRWWQGVGAVLDVTNPNATKWFVARLKKFQKDYKLDSFKFDAGEVHHLPQFINSHQPLINPNHYTRQYADVVAQFGDAVEMRSAFRNQKHAMFVRMMDKDSVWGYNNGLKTIIPTALIMSITGYHYILPDMIGGNGYGQVDFLQTELPSKDLFVRWMQLSAFLPSMQFSFTPWQYDEEVIHIALDMVKTHEERVTPAFFKAAETMLKDGSPIIRPIWWLDPHDLDALDCDSEFMVSDQILVAPVLEDGARTRDIYLPVGRWYDDLKNAEILGPTWLKEYSAELKDIPTFTYLGIL